MPSFFDTIEPEVAAEFEQLSRLMYELRENRNTVLAPYRTDDAAALLARIQAGDVDEHPGYEHYLSARILDATRETVRTVLREGLKEVRQA